MSGLAEDCQFVSKSNDYCFCFLFLNSMSFAAEHDALPAEKQLILEEEEKQTWKNVRSFNL